MRQFKRFIGIFITVASIGLLYIFIRSEAWFGIMIGLFLGAFGVRAILQPDYAFRLGGPEDDKPDG